MSYAKKILNSVEGREVRTKIDGVYVDASRQGKIMTIAYFRVQAGLAADKGSKTVDVENTNIAEEMAIRWAKDLFPDQLIFSDHQGAISKFASGVLYIKGSKNPAHHVARQRIHIPEMKAEGYKFGDDILRGLCTEIRINRKLKEGFVAVIITEEEAKQILRLKEHLETNKVLVQL